MNNNQERDQQVAFVSVESSAVQAHLQFIQDGIQRMGTNSAYCKTWCITVISAMFVVGVDNNKPELVLYALAPIFLFYILDAHYLSIENAFKQSYDDFITKLHKNQLTMEDLYAVHIKEREISWDHQLEALKSFSAWALYAASATTSILVVGVVFKYA